jgi:hypothetical protein
VAVVVIIAAKRAASAHVKITIAKCATKAVKNNKKISTKAIGLVSMAFCFLKKE